MNLYETIAQKISDELNYNVVFSNDETVSEEERNNTRGVLRLNSSERGANPEIRTEKVSFFVSFIVKLCDESNFLKNIRTFMDQYQAYAMSLEEGMVARFVFGSFVPTGDAKPYNGIKYTTYQLDFDCFIYEDALMSDDLAIYIDDVILTGVLSYQEGTKYQRETHITSASNIPAANGTTKVRSYSFTFLPVKGNEASNKLIQMNNEMIEDAVKVKVEWPADNPVLKHEKDALIDDFEILLTKGAYGQIKIVLTEYKEVV